MNLSIMKLEEADWGDISINLDTSIVYNAAMKETPVNFFMKISKP